MKTLGKPVEYDIIERLDALEELLDGAASLSPRTTSGFACARLE